MYDLTRERRGRFLWDLPTRIAVITVGGLGASLGLYLGIFHTQSLPPGEASQYAVLFVAAAGLSAIVVGLILKPGPSRIEVGGAGVDALAPGRRRSIVRWSDPRLKIVLVDFREDASKIQGYLRSRTAMMWVSPGWRGFDLSQDALEGIVRSATEAGLTVSRSVGDPSSGFAKARRFVIKST